MRNDWGQIVGSPMATVELSWAEVMKAIAAAAAFKAGLPSTWDLTHDRGPDVMAPPRLSVEVLVLRMPLHVDFHDGRAVILVKHGPSLDRQDVFVEVP